MYIRYTNYFGVDWKSFKLILNKFTTIKDWNNPSEILELLIDMKNAINIIMKNNIDFFNAGYIKLPKISNKGNKMWGDQHNFMNSNDFKRSLRHNLSNQSLDKGIIASTQYEKKNEF